MSTPASTKKQLIHDFARKKLTELSGLLIYKSDPKGNRFVYATKRYRIALAKFAYE